MNLNRVILTGNLTADPEHHEATETTSARCRLRIAVNGRRKDGELWVEKPNYFNVTVFGGQADNCARYLGKGRAVAVDGRLDWHQWTVENEVKREAVSIIAESVQFLGPKPAEVGRSDLAAETEAEAAAPSAVEPPAPVAAVVGAEVTDEETIPF